MPFLFSLESLWELWIVRRKEDPMGIEPAGAIGQPGSVRGSTAKQRAPPQNRARELPAARRPASRFEIFSSLRRVYNFTNE